MKAIKGIRGMLAVATLAATTGLFSANGFGMPMPAGVDVVGRSSDWMLKHGFGTTPKVADGRDVNGVSGRASTQALPASRGGAVKSVTSEPRGIGTFGRA